MLLKTNKRLASGPEDKYVCCAVCDWEHVAHNAAEAEYKLYLHLGTHAARRPLRERLGRKVPLKAIIQ